MVQLSKQLNQYPGFHHAMLGLIVLNALLLGVETNTALVRQFPITFNILNLSIQILFFLEISIRIIAFWPKPFHFFKDGWNVFDFLIVLISFLPVAGSFANVARLARVLRVTRLISLSDDLKLIVGTMLKSIPSLAHVGLLLGILLYVYSILGFHLFHQLDPVHWGGLGSSMLSLFKILTLEGWVEMQDQVIHQYSFAWIYFMSFIVLAVFVVVNLFIAVVINNLETVKEQHNNQRATLSNETLIIELADLRNKLALFEKHLRKNQSSLIS